MLGMEEIKVKKQTEYFDTDFLNNKIEIGDKVIFEVPGYRAFVIGTVVTKAPKSCQIEYINDWNYPSNGRSEIVRQGYDQIIKYPIKEGSWIFLEHAGGSMKYYKCSCCNIEYPIPSTWNTQDVIKYLKYCSTCGARMKEQANNV